MSGREKIERAASVALLVEPRYLDQPQPLGLARALRRRGCEVTLIQPDSHAVCLTDAAWLAGVDVCVARGRSDAVMSCVLAAEHRGIPTLNRHSAIAAVRDKAAMAVALAGAGVPTPPTSLGSPAQLAEQLDPLSYPVILKPIRGDNCRGLRVCENADDVARLVEALREPFLAQPYLNGDGTDLKLYGIGEHVWAVRKRSPLRAGGSLQAPHGACPVPLTADLRDIAFRCAKLFGLALFGVDCLLTPAGPVVIEVNEYPNYTGVVGADGELATHVMARLPVELPA